MAGGIERTMVPALVLVCAASIVPAEGTPRFGINVLTNPGAEAGPASANWSVVPIPAWTTTAGFTVIAYGATSSAPTSVSPGPSDRGANLFCGGTSSISTASQNIDVTPLASAIDSGLITCLVGGWLGGVGLEEDVMILNVVFRDPGGASLFSANIVGPTSFERGDLTALLWRQTSQVLPPGTRSIGINLLAQRVQGTLNNAYADSLTVTLSHACPADMDNGTGQGVPDGGVDVNDLLFFVPQYEAANAVADIDDGNGQGVPDGGVDINDLLYFLLHYEGGC